MVAEAEKGGLDKVLSGLTWGRALAVAGDGRALAVLRSHALSCDVGERSGLPLLSASLLGELLEKKGDTAGACEAYGRVITRWGNAKPRSVTGDAAKARWAALGCKGKAVRDGGAP